MKMSIEKEENTLQILRLKFTENDLINKEIRKSSLMRADRGGQNMNDDEKRSIKRLKNDHLDALEAMIMGTNLKV